MKVYATCCVPVQVPYLGKIWFLRYRPKCSQPIRSQQFYISHISKMNLLNSLIFYIWYKFMKAKLLLKILRVNMVKNEWSQILKLAVSQEWIDGIYWFLYADKNLTTLKVTSMIFGWLWSKNGRDPLFHGTLRYAVPQKLINRADCMLVMMQ